MREYNRIDILEGIHINKTNASKECYICHYYYFFDKGFKYEPCVCNACHDLIQKAMNFNDVTIVSIKENDYRIHMEEIGIIICLKKINKEFIKIKKIIIKLKN